MCNLATILFISSVISVSCLELQPTAEVNQTQSTVPTVQAVLMRLNPKEDSDGSRDLEDSKDLKDYTIIPLMKLFQDNPANLTYANVDPNSQTESNKFQMDQNNNVILRNAYPKTESLYKDYTVPGNYGNSQTDGNRFQMDQNNKGILWNQYPKPEDPYKDYPVAGNYEDYYRRMNPTGDFRGLPVESDSRTGDNRLQTYPGNNVYLQRLFGEPGSYSVVPGQTINPARVIDQGTPKDFRINPLEHIVEVNLDPIPETYGTDRGQYELKDNGIQRGFKDYFTQGGTDGISNTKYPEFYPADLLRLAAQNDRPIPKNTRRYYFNKSPKNESGQESYHNTSTNKGAPALEINSSTTGRRATLPNLSPKDVEILQSLHNYFLQQTIKNHFSPGPNPGSYPAQTYHPYNPQGFFPRSEGHFGYEGTTMKEYPSGLLTNNDGHAKELGLAGASVGFILVTLGLAARDIQQKLSELPFNEHPIKGIIMIVKHAMERTVEIPRAILIKTMTLIESILKFFFDQEPVEKKSQLGSRTQDVRWQFGNLRKGTPE